MESKYSEVILGIGRWHELNKAHLREIQSPYAGTLTNFPVGTTYADIGKHYVGAKGFFPLVAGLTIDASGKCIEAGISVGEDWTVIVKNSKTGEEHIFEPFVVGTVEKESSTIKGK